MTLTYLERMNAMEDKIESLLEEIANTREELIEKAVLVDHFSDPRIVKISQELDLLISHYQKLLNNQ
jgi:Spo0E like sporulation regulatory protein